MSPSEFYTQYGIPNIKVYTLSVGDTIVIPPNEHRYLLAFMCPGDTMFIFPDTGIEVGFGAINLTAGALPIVFTHALHGSLVNISWMIQTAAPLPGARIIVADGRMDPISKKAVRRKNAKNT